MGRKVNLPNFKNLHLLGDDFAEIEVTKIRQKLNLPVQIGFAILQYAKLKMLEWYYDFLDVFVDRSDFEYIEMDTDHAYFAITAPSLEQVITPEKKAEFDMRLYGSCHGQIHPNSYRFPRQCCAKYKAFDKCLPGLFKLEQEGVVMVALRSKTYVLRDGEGVEKTALKGMNKKFVSQSFDKCKHMLISVVNLFPLYEGGAKGQI